MTKIDYLKNKRVLSIMVAFTVVIVSSLTVGPAVYATAEDLLTADSSSPAVSTSTPSTSNSGVPSGKVQTSVATPVGLNPSFSYPDTGFVQAGIGLRNVGSGTISVHLPFHSTMQKAWLYWTTMDAGTATVPASSGQNIAFFNGERVVGTLIGSSISPCWASPNIYVYRADVTDNMLRRGGALDDQYFSTYSAIVYGVSPWTTVAGQQSESAHLLVTYKNTDAGTSTVGTTTQIFDAVGFPGTFTDTAGGIRSYTAVFAAAHVAGSQASVGYALADGQFFGVSQPNGKSFTWSSGASSTLLASGEIYGKDPSLTSLSSVRGSLSDTAQYGVAANTPGGATSGTFTWNFNGDCLSVVYAAVQS